MMHDHEDPEFDRWLQDAAKSYHSPPAPPRDAMWARIAAERRRRGVVPLRPWMRWAIAAAALIAIGVGIGRWTARQPSAPATPLAAGTSAQPGDSAATALVYRMAATQYFSRAEAFLTSYRTDARGGAHSARFAGQARDLLTTTQLMLDSPAGNDAQLRSLLEDLELVLVQISQLEPGGRRATHDADYITQSMDQSNVLPKLRSAIPAGPVPVRTQGVL